jgi:FKBP-type peptidyl-prolyl cis-trans isomerase
LVRNAFAPTLLVLTLLAGSAYAAAKPASKPAPAPAAAPPAPAPVVDVKAQNAAKSEAFLAANAKLPGIVTLPSGLQYKIVHSGPANAASPKPGDVIKVNYEGALVDGTVFDSSFQRGKPALMPLGNLVPAWMEALPLMHVGDEWMLYVPPALGYGPEGRGPIPPASVMVFRLQLLGMLSAD